MTVFSFLSLLVTILCWLLNFKEIKAFSIDETPHEKGIDEISFGNDCPYFQQLKNGEDLYKPFLESGKQEESPEGKYRKKTVV